MLSKVFPAGSGVFNEGPPDDIFSFKNAKKDQVSNGAPPDTM